MAMNFKKTAEEKKDKPTKNKDGKPIKVLLKQRKNQKLLKRLLLLHVKNTLQVGEKNLIMYLHGMVKNTTYSVEMTQEIL